MNIKLAETVTRALADIAWRMDALSRSPVVDSADLGLAAEIRAGFDAVKGELAQALASVRAQHPQVVDGWRTPKR